jgi:hypothetical protein
MVNSAFSPNESLRSILAERARAASDTRLILDVAAGLLVVLAIAIWHPRSWVVPLSMGSTLAAYGAWGLIDREIAERVAGADDRLLRALRVLRGFAVVAGVASACVACFAILGIGLGEWKS